MYDPYNYPFPSRNNTMYLSTIHNEDAKIRKFKVIDTKRDFSMNLINADIESYFLSREQSSEVCCVHKQNRLYAQKRRH